MIPYGVMMIDPPWPKKKGGIRKVRPCQGRTLDYQTLTVDSVFQLLDQDLFHRTDPNHAVFLWTVDEFMLRAEAAMEKRGYRRHARMIWDKGNGPAPAFSIRYSHEYLVWFYKEKFIPVARDTRGKFTTVFYEAPREHSRKPDLPYQMIQAMYPTLKKIDVFSREPRDGWDQYGDQCAYFSSLPRQ